MWTDEKLFRQSATGVSGQHSRFWKDEHNNDGSRNSNKTAIRTQTPTGKGLKLFGTQHNPGIMVSLAVSLETRILGPLFVELGIKVSGAYYVEGPADAQSQRIPSLVVIASEFVAGRQREASCSESRPQIFGIWNHIEAKLRGNRAIDMDTLKADISRVVTQLNSDTEWPTVVSVIHIFLPRLHRVQTNAGSHCES